MSKEHASLSEQIAAALNANARRGEGVRAGGRFLAVCHDRHGNEKWRTAFDISEADHNLVVNVGLKDMNEKYFTGSGYTAAWYLGLYGAAASNNPAAGDTASSHAGWTEFTNYSQATRPAATFGSSTTADPSVISNTASPAVFSINGAGGTVGGAFLISNNTKGGTTGILFSAADFQSPGDRTTADGDTLNVTYQFSLDAA